MSLWDLACVGIMVAVIAGAWGLSYGYTTGCRDCSGKG